MPEVLGRLRGRTQTTGGVSIETVELVACWWCGGAYIGSGPLYAKPCPDCEKRFWIIKRLLEMPADGLLVLYVLGVDEGTLLPMFPYIKAAQPILGVFSEPEIVGNDLPSSPLENKGGINFTIYDVP